MALTALVSAHAASAWNRSTRQLTRAGRNVALAFIGFIWLSAASGFSLGMGVLGWAAGRDFAGRGGTLAGVTAFALSYGLGLVFGITGGGRLLEVGQLRAYPVRPFTLLCAELAARLAEPLTAGVVLALLAFLVGLGISAPQLTPRLVVLYPLLVWVLLSAQFVLGELLGALARRARVALVIVFVLAMGLSPRTVLWLTAAQPASPLDRFTYLASFAQWLPTTRMLMAPEGGLGAVLRLFEGLLPPLLLTLVGIWVMTREQSAHASVATERETGLWTFEAPVAGVSRLHLSSLFRTPVGRYHLIAPLFAMVMIPWVTQLAFGVQRASLFVFLYAAFGTVQLHFNVFGFDGPAVSELFRLPLDGRSVLAGKHRAVFAMTLLEGAALAVFLRLLRDEQLDECVAGLCVFLAVNGVMASLGSFVSVLWPRTLPRSGMRGSAPPLPVVLVNIFGTLSIVGTLGGSHWLVLHYAPQWLIPWGLLVLAAAAGLYALLLGPAARFLDARREHVLLAMK